MKLLLKLLRILFFKTKQVEPKPESEIQQEAFAKVAKVIISCRNSQQLEAAFGMILIYMKYYGVSPFLVRQYQLQKMKLGQNTEMAIVRTAEKEFIVLN